MAEDIRFAKAGGADAVVFGLLRPDATVDEERTARLIEIARPMQVTFHRAYDVSRDLFESLDALIRLGVERVLTTGGANHTLEAVDTIRELVAASAGQIAIMCGRTNEHTITKTIAATGVREIHLNAPMRVTSGMREQSSRCQMGAMGVLSDEYAWVETDPESVRRAIRHPKI